MLFVRRWIDNMVSKLHFGAAEGNFFVKSLGLGETLRVAFTRSQATGGILGSRGRPYKD